MGRQLHQPTTPPVGVFFGLMAVGCVDWLGFLMCSYLPNLPTVLPVQKSMVRLYLSFRLSHEQENQCQKVKHVTIYHKKQLTTIYGSEKIYHTVDC